jgi:hypothetical protein
MKTKLTLMSLLFCAGAQAQFRTGNDLYNGLKDGADSFDNTTSTAYIAGAYDSARDKFCAPQGIQLGQVRDIVKKHLEANPQHRHLDGYAHVSYALIQTWPCPKKGQP